MNKFLKNTFASLALAAVICGAAFAAEPQPLVIAEQGVFAAGGTVKRNPGKFDPYKWNAEGQTLHGDHARVFYQIPQNAKKLPLVFLHGAGQSMATWQTTPDGREGFRTSSCAAASRSIFSTSRDADRRGARPWTWR